MLVFCSSVLPLPSLFLIICWSGLYPVCASRVCHKLPSSFHNKFGWHSFLFLFSLSLSWSCWNGGFSPDAGSPRMRTLSGCEVTPLSAVVSCEYEVPELYFSKCRQINLPIWRRPDEVDEETSKCRPPPQRGISETHCGPRGEGLSLCLRHTPGCVMNVNWTQWPILSMLPYYLKCLNCNNYIFNL